MRCATKKSLTRGTNKKISLIMILTIRLTRERKKGRLITAGLVLTKFLILPAVVMAVKGFKMSTTGKAYGKWNKVFDSFYDVTPKSVVAV